MSLSLSKNQLIPELRQLWQDLLTNGEWTITEEEARELLYLSSPNMVLWAIKATQRQITRKNLTLTPDETLNTVRMYIGRANADRVASRNANADEKKRTAEEARQRAELALQREGREERLPVSVDPLDVDLYPVEETDQGLPWIVGPSPDEIAADVAQALLDETEEEVESLFAAQHTNKKAECVDIFDAVLEQLNSISPIRTVSWKISSSARYKPRVASVLDFRADASMAAKRTLSAYDYVWFDNVFMQGLWPVAIVPPVALARIHIAVGSAWKRAGLAHYFQYTPPKKVLHQ